MTPTTDFIRVFHLGALTVPGPRSSRFQFRREKTVRHCGCLRTLADKSVVGVRESHRRVPRFWVAGAPSQSRSTAKRFRSASEQKLKATSCVARNTSRGARPACSASCHRGAHRHQRSPGFSPGKPNSGTGVERSLPQDFEYSRNPAVMTAHTV